MPDSPARTTRRARHQGRHRRSKRGLSGAALSGAAVGALAALALLAVGLGVNAFARSRQAPYPAAPSTVPTTTAAATLTPEAEVPTESVEPTPALPPTITVAAVGDMIFDRQVKALIAKSGGEAPLAQVAERLAAADFTCGNLESPLSTGGTRAKGKEVCFRGDPRGAEGLQLAGFDAISIANNHALDYGSVALADTAATLDERGIAHSGAGAGLDAAWAPAVVEVGDATVAYLAFSHILPPGFTATDSRAGIAQGRANMDQVAAAVSSAAAEHDYVIVSFHWGIEYVDDANAEQVRDARRAIDSGADLVIAHHPHVLQGVERYKAGLIAYSLGDFVFDHYSRKTGEAFILDIALGPHGAGETTVTPVYLDTYGRPAVVTGKEAQVILQRLEKVSAKHGTDVVIDGDIARVAR